MGQGMISKSILRSIADYIRLRKGTQDTVKPKDMRAELDTIPTYEEGEQEGYKKGYADGEVAGEKNGTLQYSRTAQFANLNLFGKKEIEVYMPILLDATEMFSPAADGTNNTVEHITLTGDSTCTEVYSMFNMQWRGGPLKHITFNIDFSKVTDGRYFFNNHGGIVTIDGQPLDFSSCTGNLHFHYLSNLEYIRFVPGTVKCNLAISSSNKLSDASIQSIIDGLADLTGQTAQKVSFHTDIILKLTEEQIVTIGNKNWTM